MGSGFGGRGRGRGGGGGDVGVVTNEREGVAALACPFIHAPLDVAGAADFEEDFLLCCTSTAGCSWGDARCSSSPRRARGIR